jgi:hypothetical protein
VEASIRGLVVFRSAFRAQREAAHGRAFAIVGRGFHDVEARAAIGAIQKRVAKTSIFRGK